MRLSSISRISLLAAAALLLSCGKGEKSVQTTFEVTPATLQIEAIGGNIAFTVKCGESWMAASNQSWTKLLTVSGKGGSTPAEVNVSVEENVNTTERSAIITVTTLSGEKKTVSITQAKGSGSSEAKGISTAAELLAFASAVNSGASINKYLVNGDVALMADIDASSIKEWTPIGTSTNPLVKNFDGKGHSIKNVNWTVDASKFENAGFIGYAKKIQVKNLTFGSDGSTMVLGGSASGTFGGIVGYGETITMTAVTNKTSISATAGTSALMMGGFCGRITTDSFIGDSEKKKNACVNDGNVSSSFACRTAGFVGYNEGTIVNCTNNGAITGAKSQDNKLGAAWGCGYNSNSAKFTSNFGYGTVNGKAAVHSTAVVYPSGAYDLEKNTVDWTKDDYFEWNVLEEKQLHSGVKYMHCSFTGMPRHMHVLQIDLSNPNVELTTAFAQEQIPNPNANGNSNNGKNLRELLSEVCSRRRAEGQNIIAGVNTGFFDSNDGIARGFHIEEGEPVYVNNPAVVSGLPNHSWGLTVFADGTASCNKKKLSAYLEAGGKQYVICSVNDTIMRHVAVNYPVNMYTCRYKQYPHASKKSITNPLVKNALYVIAQWKSDPVKVNTGWAEATITDVMDGSGTPLSTGPYLSSSNQVGFAITGATAAALSSLKAGDVIRAKFDMTIEGEDVKAIYTQNSSMYKFMEDGKDASTSPGTSSSVYTKYDPLTFPVVSQDKKTVWLVEVDGRQTEYSYGVKSYEIFRIAQKLGGWNCTRFDGGGSSCMWVYDSAKSSGGLVNRVSDSKGERSCMNYMLVRIKQ